MAGIHKVYASSVVLGFIRQGCLISTGNFLCVSESAFIGTPPVLRRLNPDDEEDPSTRVNPFLTPMTAYN
jgi:hypothetical protein